MVADKGMGSQLGAAIPLCVCMCHGVSVAACLGEASLEITPGFWAWTQDLCYKQPSSRVMLSLQVY